MLPFLVGTAGIVAIYFLVRYWGMARWLALTAAFAVAVSPVATQFSTHVKQYSTDFLLTCFLLWMAEAARRSPTSRRLTGLGVGSGVAILISAAVTPIIVGSWVAVLICNARNSSDRRRITLAGVGMAAFLGVVYLLLFQSLPGVLHRYWALSGAFLTRWPPSALWHSLGYAWSVITVGVIAPAGRLDVYGDPLWSAGRVFWPAVILLALMVCGITALKRAAVPALSLLAAFAASFIGAIPLGTGRTDDVLYPAVVLLAVLGLQQIVAGAGRLLATRAPQWRVVGTGILIASLILFALASFNSTTVRHPPQYPNINVRQLAAFLTQHRQAADGVLVDPYTRYPWTLYEADPVHIQFGSGWGAGFSVVSGQPDVFVSPSEPWEDGYDPQAWVGQVADAGRLWYLGTWFLPRNEDPIYQAMLAQGWKPQGEYDATGGFVVLMTGGGTSGPGLVRQGTVAQSRGDLELAVTRFQAAMAKDPSDVSAPYDLGVLFQQRLHNGALAASYYTKALAVDPTFKSALFNLALVETPKNPARAISLYNQLLALNANSPQVLWNLGLLLISQNQSSQGHADLAKAVALDPTLAKQAPPGVTP